MKCKLQQMTGTKLSYRQIVMTISFTLCLYVGISAQPHQKVEHLSGTVRINGIDVTVTPGGQTAILTQKNYCDGETGPYYIGYNTQDYSCSNGWYTFNFSPPVSEVTLNFTGLSRSVDYNEEVLIYVNGWHYPIKHAGVRTSCEKLADLTSDGNITGCLECPTSGWLGTHIEGPIYSLKIKDSVIFGEPAGALFSLHMGVLSLEDELGSHITAYKRESAAGSDLIIEAEEGGLQLLSIHGPNGDRIDFNEYSNYPAISIDISKFTKEEEYTIELQIGKQVITKKITIW